MSESTAQEAAQHALRENRAYRKGQEMPMCGGGNMTGQKFSLVCECARWDKVPRNA